MNIQPYQERPRADKHVLEKSLCKNLKPLNDQAVPSILRESQYLIRLDLAEKHRRISVGGICIEGKPGSKDQQWMPLTSCLASVSYRASIYNCIELSLGEV